MNITSKSMEAVIMRNMDDLDGDPHLKKLLDELQELQKELNIPKVLSNVQLSSSSSGSVEKKTVDKVTVKRGRKRKRGTEGDDTTFRCAVSVSSIRRKSRRLSGNIPNFELVDDIDEIENTTLYSRGQLNLSRHTRRQRRSSVKRRYTTMNNPIDPSEVTEEMLNNICYKMSDRIYDAVNGTCCHQCRQKTMDTKTICRNLECVGLRGQFCGPCSQNRYGVNIVDALLDPYWSCFVCQGICNCSFCRNREGKRATGIMTPMAKREGHDCVKEFLDTLQSRDDEEDDNGEQIDDPENVLGFINEAVVSTVGGPEQLVNFSSGLRSRTEFVLNFRGFTDAAIAEANDTKDRFQSIVNRFE